MSVFVLSPAEFGAISATLRTARHAPRDFLFPLSDQERLEFLLLHEGERGASDVEYRQSLVDSFVYRLYLANAMAEQYTYWKGGKDEFRLPLIDFPPSTPVTLRELLKLLRSLRYNIVTNGGNTFLGVKDDEKLRDIIAAVQSSIIDGGHTA